MKSHLGSPQHRAEKGISMPEQAWHDHAKDSIFLHVRIVSAWFSDQGWSAKKAATELGLNDNTVRAILSGHGVNPATAKLIADKMKKKVTDILAPYDRRHPPIHPESNQHEWINEGPMSGSFSCPNGLIFVPCRMRHRETTRRVGRGKCYFLSLMDAGHVDAIRHQLQRHAEVCCRIGQHPNIALNLANGPGATKSDWWVVDDWVGELTLADFLISDARRLPVDRIPSLLLEIATAISVLHSRNIILRDAAPCRVLITDDLARAVVTDFELAKVLENVPSVVGDWNGDSRYRAPEVKEGNATPAADIYSLAVIAAAMVNHQLPEKSQEGACLQDSTMPARLKEMLIKCLSPAHEDRLQEVGPLLAELKKWT